MTNLPSLVVAGPQNFALKLELFLSSEFCSVTFSIFCLTWEREGKRQQTVGYFNEITAYKNKFASYCLFIDKNNTQLYSYFCLIDRPKGYFSFVLLRLRLQFNNGSDRTAEWFTESQNCRGLEGTSRDHRVQPPVHCAACLFACLSEFWIFFSYHCLLKHFNTPLKGKKNIQLYYLNLRQETGKLSPEEKRIWIIIYKL